MEAGLMEIVQPLNRSWIYDTYFSLCRAIHPGGKVRGKISGGGDVRIPYSTDDHRHMQIGTGTSVCVCSQSHPMIDTDASRHTQADRHTDARRHTHRQTHIDRQTHRQTHTGKYRHKHADRLKKVCVGMRECVYL